MNKKWTNKKCLITGGAGFIGSHLVDKLLALGAKVVVVDNFNPYYNPGQKEKNIFQALKNNNFTIIRGNILDDKVLKKAFQHKFDHIFHLAAMAGVRNSFSDPVLYYQTNAIGTLKILEKIRKDSTTQFILGSSSSVYGGNQTPFSEEQSTFKQISPYANSKKISEMITQAYADLYKIPTTILRFFTVYGPRCRPDMAPYKFIRAIINNQALTKFGTGKSSRDYTYIDDIVRGLISAAEEVFPFEIINLGGSHPTSLNNFIDLIEKLTKNKAQIKTFPMPKGDVKKTLAKIEKAKKMLNWQPKIDLETGLKKTIDWLKKTDL